MKFNCGKPYTFAEHKAHIAEWHRWFAWRPVRVADNDCRWLEFVERRGEVTYCLYDIHYEWEYRAIEKELK